MKACTIIALSFAAALGCGCASAPDAQIDVDSDREPALAVDAAASATESPRPNNDCWHVAPDGSALVAVWVSPRMDIHVPGGFRFVNLIYHDPNARGGLMLHSRPARCDGDETIGLNVGPRSLRAKPAAGLTWRTVVAPRDVDVQFEGASNTKRAAAGAAAANSSTTNGS
ncbi:MAG: hypothetical protein KAI24_01910 [Planctomycetes bacterium]|nr:hypothetical protein [Planctomycetota bacterium]